jgi:hypothetical protein
MRMQGMMASKHDGHQARRLNVRVALGPILLIAMTVFGSGSKVNWVLTVVA